MSLAASTLLLLPLLLIPSSSLFPLLRPRFLIFPLLFCFLLFLRIEYILFRSAARAKRSCLRKEEAFLPARGATERRGNWFRSRTLERIAFLSCVYGARSRKRGIRFVEYLSRYRVSVFFLFVELTLSLAM